MASGAKSVPPPYLVERPSVRHAKSVICSTVAALCREKCGANLRALILTGSLARNEASVQITEGEVRVQGDADFLLVVNRPKHQLASADGDLIAKRAKRILSEQRIACQVGLGTVTSRYLSRLTPHIFGFELKHFGHVVAGDPRILSSIPNFDARDIPLHDAWCLLCNRVTEQLEMARELRCDRDVASEATMYGMVKLYLDMATSLLVFLRAYKPSYSERCQELLRLARGNSTTVPFALDEFATYVGICTDIKLNRPAGNSCITRDMWWKAVEYAAALWSWERDRLNGSANSYQKLHGLAPEPLYNIVRGWASVIHRQSWRETRANAGRWFRLGLRGSPRNHIYSVSTRLFFQLRHLVSSNATTEQNKNVIVLRRQLPLLMKQKPLSWQEIAGEVSRNYRELLVSTRS